MQEDETGLEVLGSLAIVNVLSVVILAGGCIVLIVLILIQMVAMALTNCRTTLLLTGAMLGGTLFFLICKGGWKRFLLGLMVAGLVLVGSFKVTGKLFQWNNDRLLASYGTAREEAPTAQVPAMEIFAVEASAEEISEEQTDDILELSCNLDDMTGEAIGYAMERLLEDGALDAYTVPIGMKKSRPGTMLCVLCREGDKKKLVRSVFVHTTTLGIREVPCTRYTLTRTVETVQTALGPVRKKTAAGYGVARSKWEYEDIRKLALSQNCSLSEIEEQIKA